MTNLSIMLLISHRANLNGRNPKTENSPDAIDAAISLRYDVEVDVWYDNGKWFLGHDKPTYAIGFDWLAMRDKRLWVHCKNIDAMTQLHGLPIHHFWHENDTLTLTSRGIIWAYPGKQPIKRSIAVLPEIHNDSVDGCIGICSDVIHSYGRYSNK